MAKEIFGGRPGGVGLGEQGHIGLGSGYAALAVVAGWTGGYQVVPGVFAT